MFAKHTYVVFANNRKKNTNTNFNDQKVDVNLEDNGFQKSP